MKILNKKMTMMLKNNILVDLKKMLLLFRNMLNDLYLS